MRVVLASLLVATLALAGCTDKRGPSVSSSGETAVVDPSVVNGPIDKPDPAAKANTIEAALAALYPRGKDGKEGMGTFERSWIRTVGQEDTDAIQYSHEVCLRERAGSFEYVAVCASTDDGGHPTPGLIDLHVFDVSSANVRVVDSLWQMTSNGFGQPQDPDWLQIGPREYAVVVKSGYTSTGETSSEHNWLSLVDGKLVSVLSYPNYHAYASGCDASAPECSDHSQECEAEVVRGKPADAWGRWPIVMRASSQVREEPETTRSMLLPSNGKGYVFSNDDAVKLNCIDG